MENIYASYERKAVAIPGKQYRVAFDEKMKNACWVCSCQKKISDLSVESHEKTCPNKEKKYYLEHLIYIIGPQIRLDNCPLNSRMIEIFNRKTKNKISIIPAYKASVHKSPKYKDKLQYNSD